MPNVVDLREWADYPLSDLPDLNNLELSKSGIADRLMGGMCAQTGIGMLPFGLQAVFANPFGLAGLSKVGTALGNFERHGGGGYTCQVNFPEFGGDRYTQVAVINYVPPAAVMPGFIRMSGPGNGYSHSITINADGTLSVNCNGVAGLIATTAILATGLNVIIFTNDRVSGSQKLYLNNAEVGSAANTAYGGFGQSFNTVGENTAGNTSVGLFYGLARIINRAQIELLSFDPTLIFEPEESYSYFPAAGGALYFQTLIASAGTSVSLSKALTVTKSLIGIAVSSSSLSKLLTSKRTLSLTSLVVTSLDKTSSFFKTLSVIVTGSSLLGKVVSLFKTLSASSSGVATLSKNLIAGLTLKTLSAVSIGAPTLTKVLNATRALNASSSGVVVLSAISTRLKTLSATVANNPSLGKNLIIGLILKTLSASSGGVATLGKALIFTKGLSATAAGMVVYQRGFSKIINFVASTQVSMSRRFSLTKSAIAGSIVSLSKGNVFIKIISAASVSIAALSFIYISATSLIRNIIKVTITFGTGLSKKVSFQRKKNKDVEF